MTAEDTSPPAGPSDRLNDWALRAEDPRDPSTRGAWRKLASVSAIAGLVFAVLYLASYLLLDRTPLGGASDQQILAYYAEGRNLTITIAGMLVMPFAGIAFLYFMEAMRASAMATGLRFSRLLASVQLATGILFVGLLFVATASIVATPASIRFADASTDPIVARMLPTLGTAILLMFAMRAASMFVFTTSSIGRATGLIPSWFTWVGYAVGLLLLFTATLATWFALLFPAWVVALCAIVLWQHSARHTEASSDHA